MDPAALVIPHWSKEVEKQIIIILYQTHSELQSKDSRISTNFRGQKSGDQKQVTLLETTNRVRYVTAKKKKISLVSPHFQKLYLIKTSIGYEEIKQTIHKLEQFSKTRKRHERALLFFTFQSHAYLIASRTKENFL